MIGSEPAIPAALVDLALWIADYYFTAPGEMLRALLPAGSLGSGERKVRLTARARDLLTGGLRPPGLNPKETLLLETLAREGDMSLEKLGAQTGLKDAAQWIESCVERGWAQVDDAVVRGRVMEKIRLGIRALAGDPETHRAADRAAAGVVPAAALGGTDPDSAGGSAAGRRQPEHCADSREKRSRGDRPHESGSRPARAVRDRLPQGAGLHPRAA